MADRKKTTITELQARERRWEVMNFEEVLQRGMEMGVIPIMVEPEPGWQIISTKIEKTETGLDVVVIEIKEPTVHGFLLMRRADPLLRAGSNFL